MMNSRGQIAAGFLVILAFLLVMIRMTVRTGQMAQVRVETANAADASALAAASWIASGQNEAALIARDMQDTLMATEAIYLVPFQHGPVLDDYAQDIWNGLQQKPTAIGPGFCGAVPGGYNYAGCGPIAYLRSVAQGALEAGWRIGHREFLGAAVNNMMIRFLTGNTFGPPPPGCDPDFPLSCVGDETHLGDLRQRIHEMMVTLEQTPAPRWILGDGGILTWNNGLPPDDPNHLTHAPTYDLDAFPSRPPELRMDATAYGVDWYQYRPPVPASSGAHYACEFEMPAITGPVIPHPWAYPDVPLLPTYPLGVDADGRKAWDSDLNRMVPALYAGSGTRPPLPIQVATIKVCGADAKSTPGLPELKPQALQIADGEDVIRVKVAHQVNVKGGTDTVTDDGTSVEFTTWTPRFPKVESEAEAKYTVADIATTDQPMAQPNAKAFLVSTQ